MSWLPARWRATCWAIRVTQFSTVIGSYLFAMGVGTWLSRYRGTRAGGALHRRSN